MPERNVLTSLSGAVAPMVSVSTSSLQQINDHSIWTPRDWRKSTPFVIDDITMAPNNQSLLNAEMAFEFPKLAHMIKDISVRTITPPFVIAPPGNPAFYVDHVGYAMFEYLRMQFGSNQLYERQPYDNYFKYRKALEIERRDAVNDLINGDKTMAQRQLSLVNGDELYTDNFLPFEQHTTQAFPLLTISQKLRILLKTQPIQNITQTPIPGTTLTQNGLFDFSILAKVVHLTGREADFILDMSRDEEGITYLIHQNVRQNSDDLGNVTTGFQPRIKLSSIQKPIRFLQWALVPTKLQNNTGRNDMFFFQPQPFPGPVPAGMTPYNVLQNWSMEANGQIIQRVVPRKYTVIRDHALYNPAPHGDEIFTQYYDQYPHAVNATIGYCDYTNLNNVVLIPTFGVGGTGTDPDIPALPQQLRLVVNTEDENFHFYHSGNVTKAFH